MYFDLAVVGNEPQLTETIHEEIDTRPGCANHLRQHFLTHSGNDLFRSFFFAKLRQKKKNSGQPFFAGIEELIHQVFLNPGVTGQKMGNENIRKFVLLAEGSHHFFPVNFEQNAGHDCDGTGHAQRVRCGNAFFATKLTVAQQGDGCFFPRPGYYAKPDPATLNIEDTVGSITLGESPLFAAKMKNRSAQAAGGKKC
jgi:hypothetical protein